MNQLNLFGEPITGKEGVRKPPKKPRASNFQRWIKYLGEHPDVFQWFEKAAFGLWARGRRHFGMGCLVEEVRHFYRLKNPTPPGEFKITDNFAAYYVRLLVVRHPILLPMFEFMRSDANFVDYKKPVPEEVDYNWFFTWRKIVNPEEAEHEED